MKSDLYMTMRTRILSPCIIVLFLLYGMTGIAYAEPFMGPWAEGRPEEASSKQTPNRFNPLQSLVKVYANYISPVDGKQCPMYPSCSTYSQLCFERHGLVMGWVMTCDRLLHEADEMGKVPIINIHGAERFYDPPENNDFWWHGER